MNLPRINLRVFLFAAALLGAAFPPVYAQAPAPTATTAATSAKAPPAPASTVPALPSQQPFGFAAAPPDGFDIISNPVIAEGLKEGGKAYYIGNRSGLDGWMLMQGNEVQTVYMTADRKTLIIGNLFAFEGYNITADQIRVLLKNNKEVANNMTQLTKQQLGVVDTDTLQPNGLPKLSAIRSMGNGAGSQETNSASTAARIFEMAQNAPAAKDAKPTPAIPPGERLLLDLQDANGVDLGAAQAPMLYMIMDPNCPHCQATWRMLRDAVLNKTLRVRLVPVGMNDEDERASAQLLRASDPLNAWDKYVAGDKSQLAGAADPKLINEVKANHAMVDSWSITETPYMAYRSLHSGDMKIVAGEPAQVTNLLADIGQ